MLQDKKYYLMVIVFDGKQNILPLVTGQNPKFTFDEYFQKEIKYDELEKKFLEIYLFYLPITFDIYNNGTKENILKSANLYSSFKVDLLTIALGPENHNIVLLDPKKSFIHLGRISYTIECSHIENINIRIKSLKVELNHLLQNEIAIKLKFKEGKNQIETNYTKGLRPTLLIDKEITNYFYNLDNNVNLNNDRTLEMKTNSTMLSLQSAYSYVNFYTVRLIDIRQGNNNQYQDTNYENNNALFGFRADSNKSINLVSHYNAIGYSIINFLTILTENDYASNKQSSQFFRQVSGFNKNNASSEESNVFTFRVFQDLNQIYKQPIIFDGAEIGTCELGIEIINIPLLRQIMSGVMTENGFEINSIYLYDNLLNNGSNVLPTDLTTLIQQKKDLNNELIKRQTQNNINSLITRHLKDIKETINKSIEENYFYYGYSNDESLYTGQNVMLDLGITLIDVVDKLNNEQRSLIFQILKVINERGELDLSTVSNKWFVEKDKISYFKEDSILKSKIIENFLEFNYLCLQFCFQEISRTKSIDNHIKVFSKYFPSLAYFRIPAFRNVFLESISEGVTENYLDDIQENKFVKKQSAADYMEIDPINNLILWELLFYNKLKSALAQHNNNNDNDIEDKLDKIEKLLKEPYVKEILSQRNVIFFSLVTNLMNYIYNRSELTNEVNWVNLPGFDNIINAILHEINVRNVRSFPQVFMNIFPLFINNINIVNLFIKKITYKTNVYDVTGIFNLVNIINSIFKEFSKRNENKIFDKFDYSILSKALKAIIKVDHSLTISKFFLFYYNNSHLMTNVHLGEICQSIFISKFYNYFFHWSYEVRDKFYHYILYIMGFRIKNYSPYADLEDLKIQNNQFIDYSGGNMQKTFGDILESKLNFINQISDILKKENSDACFNNKINPNKYGQILNKLPIEVHKNIVISINHYEKIHNEYLEWEKVNINVKPNKVVYPTLILVPPKDDVIEYN